MKIRTIMLSTSAKDRLVISQQLTQLSGIEWLGAFSHSRELVNSLKDHQFVDLVLIDEQQAYEKAVIQRTFPSARVIQLQYEVNSPLGSLEKTLFYQRDNQKLIRQRLHECLYQKATSMVKQGALEISGLPALNQVDLVVMGSSTGGTRVVEALLSQVVLPCPPIMVVQHMTAEFTLSFTERLNSQLPIPVKAIGHQMPVESGCIYVASGDYHSEVVSHSGDWFFHVHQSEKRNFHRPSIDVAFDSVAKLRGKRVAVLLSGMGKDGAEGLHHCRLQGVSTVVQSPDSAAFASMPQAALDIDSTHTVLSSGALSNYFTGSTITKH